jgi:hypothetical protein
MTFKINFPIELTPYKYYIDSEPDFDSKLVNAQWDFGDRFVDSPWSILLGDKEYYFEVNDISYVWRELPDLLHQCIEGQDSVVKFYFASQHTDTVLFVEHSSDDNSLISIVRNHSDRGFRGPPITDQDFQHVSVSTRLFLSEWRTLADTMIRLLVEYQLITVDDPSIQEFLNLMPTEK